MKQAKHLTLATIAALGIAATAPALSGSGYGHSSSMGSMSSDSARFDTTSSDSIVNAGSEAFPIPYSMAGVDSVSYDVHAVALSDDSYFALPSTYMVVNEPTLYFTNGQWYSYAEGTWYSLNEGGEWIAMAETSDTDYYAMYLFEPEIIASSWSIPIEVVEFAQPEYTLTVYSPDGNVLHVMADDPSTADMLLSSVLDGAMSLS